MSDLMFSSVFGTADSLVSSVSASSFLLCSVVPIVLGLVIAGVYMFRHRYSKNFVVTLALLPLIVQMVITLVNGNLGAGIAVMGVFNLVRFRSIPGSAKDIGSVFLAMAVGLATGMGFLGLAVLFTAIIAVVNVVYVLSPFGRPRALMARVPQSTARRRPSHQKEPTLFQASFCRGRSSSTRPMTRRFSWYLRGRPSITKTAPRSMRRTPTNAS